MKWIIVAILLINGKPIEVVSSERYDTLTECNYQMMRQMLQLHTATWSMRCQQVKQMVQQ